MSLLLLGAGRSGGGGQNTVVLPPYLLPGGTLPSVAEGFENASDWSGTAGSPTIENNTTAKQFHPFAGSQSVKVIATAGSGAVTIRKTGLNLDLSAGVYLPFWLYNHHTASQNNVTITLFNNVGSNQRIIFTVPTSRALKWNQAWILKSSGSAFNGGTFSSPIVAIDLSFTSGGVGRAISYDNLCFGVTPVPAASIQLHDGWPAHNAFAYPEMQSRGLRGVIVSHTSIIGTGSNLTYSQYLAMQANGWEWINHTTSHQDMDSQADQAAMETIIDSAKTTLIANGITSGPASNYFCYPGGESGWSYTVEDALAAQGYDMATTAGEDYTFFPYPNLLQMGQQLTGPVSGATIESQLASMVTNGGLKRMVVHDIQAASGDLTESEFTGVLDEIIAQQIPVLTESEIYQLATGNSVEVEVPW